MNFIDFLYGAAVWKMGAVISLIIVGSTILTLVVVNRFWDRELRRAHNDIAGFLIAVVGVVFAILVSSLAITVLTRQDHAEALVMQEAETLGAIYRDAGLLEPANRNALRSDLRAYLDAVIDREWPEMSRAEWPAAGDAGVSAMWADVARLPADTYATALRVTRLQSRIDTLTDIRRNRGELATTGVDRVVWGVVLFGSAATILFAVLFGVPNFLAHLLMTSLLAFTIALAIIMVVAIDWPYFGDDVINPDRLATLRTELIRDAAAPI